MAKRKNPVYASPDEGEESKEKDVLPAYKESPYIQSIPTAYRHSLDATLKALMDLPALSPNTTLEDHLNNDALLFHLEKQQLMLRWKGAENLTMRAFKTLLDATNKFIENRRKLFLKPYVEASNSGKGGYLYPLD